MHAASPKPSGPSPNQSYLCFGRSHPLEWCNLLNRNGESPDHPLSGYGYQGAKNPLCTDAVPHDGQPWAKTIPVSAIGLRKNREAIQYQAQLGPILICSCMNPIKPGGLGKRARSGRFKNPAPPTLSSWDMLATSCCCCNLSHAEAQQGACSRRYINSAQHIL